MANSNAYREHYLSLCDPNGELKGRIELDTLKSLLQVPDELMERLVKVIRGEMTVEDWQAELQFDELRFDDQRKEAAKLALESHEADRGLWPVDRLYEKPSSRSLA